jgi:hypothetical protein
MTFAQGSRRLGRMPSPTTFYSSEHVSRLRLCSYFCRGGAGVECRSGDLVCKPTGEIFMYHITRKAQRGTSTER